MGARYTPEFKLEWVPKVKGAQRLANVSLVLDVSGQTLHNWVKTDRKDEFGGAGSKPVSPRRMEIAQLRELARVKMQSDILGKATTYFARLRHDAAYIIALPAHKAGAGTGCSCSRSPDNGFEWCLRDNASDLWGALNCARKGCRQPASLRVRCQAKWRDQESQRHSRATAIHPLIRMAV